LVFLIHTGSLYLYFLLGSLSKQTRYSNYAGYSASKTVSYISPREDPVQFPFIPKPIYVWEEVEFARIYFRVLVNSVVTGTPPMVHTHSVTYYRCCIILASDSFFLRISIKKPLLLAVTFVCFGIVRCRVPLCPTYRLTWLKVFVFFCVTSGKCWGAASDRAKIVASTFCSIY